jgi:hypothetical protein
MKESKKTLRQKLRQAAARIRENKYNYIMEAADFNQQLNIWDSFLFFGSFSISSMRVHAMADGSSVFSIPGSGVLSC